MLNYSNFITKEGEEKQNNYKYESGGYTPLDDILTPYYEKLEQQMPKKLSPNIISMTASLCIIIPGLLLQNHNPNLECHYPRYFYLMTAGGILGHMILDALDGKHARKWGYETPLGEIMDHGQDAIATQFEIIMMINAFGFVGNFYPSVIIVLGWTTFWMGPWYAFHTGEMLTNSGGIGVTELELFGVFSQLMVFFIGQDGARSELGSFAFLENILKPGPQILEAFPLLKNSYVSAFLSSLADTKINNLVLITYLILLFPQILIVIRKTLEKAKKKRIAAKQWVNLVLLAFTLYCFSAVEELGQVRGYLFIGLGGYFCLAVTKIIVCDLTNQKFATIQKEQAIPLLMAAICNFSSDLYVKKLAFIITVSSGIVFCLMFYFKITRRLAQILKKDIFFV